MKRTLACLFTALLTLCLIPSALGGEIGAPTATQPVTVTFGTETQDSADDGYESGEYETGEYVSGDLVSIDGWFTVTPASGFVTDTQTYLSESTPDETWLCMFYSADTAIDVSASPAAGYEGQSLIDMDDEARKAFLDKQMSGYDWQDVDLELSVSGKDGTPFFIYSLADLEGAYLMGETLQNGMYLRFQCHRSDFSDPTAESLATLQALLETYKAAK